jgi:hypothetical protein
MKLFRSIIFLLIIINSCTKVVTNRDEKEIVNRQSCNDDECIKYIKDALSDSFINDNIVSIVGLNYKMGKQKNDIDSFYRVISQNIEICDGLILENFILYEKTNIGYVFLDVYLEIFSKYKTQFITNSDTLFISSKVDNHNLYFPYTWDNINIYKVLYKSQKKIIVVELSKPPSIDFEPLTIMFSFDSENKKINLLKTDYSYSE